LIYLLYFIM